MTKNPSHKPTHQRKIARQRLDHLLVERGLAPNHTQARAAILAGQVRQQGRRLDKAGIKLPENADLTLHQPPHPWVSRGGVKLDYALHHFSINVSGKICLDIGASSGGFTDVLLSRGAGCVYAIDVGRGQFDWRLRQDERVILQERTNARSLTRQQIPDPIDILVCDASFISLCTILPAPLTLCGPGSHLVALIKPQFEAGKHQIGKGGIIRDPDIHHSVCQEIQEWLENRDWRVDGIVASPIKGRTGNQEFLISARYHP